METSELRKQLIDQINTADEKLLKVVKAVVENYRDDDRIVAYSIEGKPFTKTQLRRQIADAAPEYEGSLSPNEQLKKEILSWKNKLN